MKQIEFGLFDWLDRATAPMHRLFEDHLKLCEAADAAGFYAYHLAEHHGTPLGMAPSPSVFLAAVAQRTKRLRLGPLVYLLPLYDPLRLVEGESVERPARLEQIRTSKGVFAPIALYLARRASITGTTPRTRPDSPQSHHPRELGVLGAPIAPLTTPRS